jgi:hypothetical protein
MNNQRCLTITSLIYYHYCIVRDVLQNTMYNKRMTASPTELVHHNRHSECFRNCIELK